MPAPQWTACIAVMGITVSHYKPWVEEAQLHHLSAAHCAAAVTFGSELLLLAGSPFITVFVPATAGLFLPPKADFLFLRLFSLPAGRRGWGWRQMPESVLSMTLPTATYAKGAARKSRKSFCISITLIMHTTTAGATFFLPFRLTMSIIMRTFAPIYIIRYGKTE